MTVDWNLASGDTSMQTSSHDQCKLVNVWLGHSCDEQSIMVLQCIIFMQQVQMSNTVIHFHQDNVSHQDLRSDQWAEIRSSEEAIVGT